MSTRTEDFAIKAIVLAVLALVFWIAYANGHVRLFPNRDITELERRVNELERPAGARQ